MIKPSALKRLNIYDSRLLHFHKDSGHSQGFRYLYLLWIIFELPILDSLD